MQIPIAWVGADRRVDIDREGAWVDADQTGIEQPVNVSPEKQTSKRVVKLRGSERVEMGCL